MSGKSRWAGFVEPAPPRAFARRGKLRRPRRNRAAKSRKCGALAVPFVRFDELADAGHLAIGAAARKQRVAVDAELTVGRAVDVEARIEIAPPTSPFELGAD